MVVIRGDGRSTPAEVVGVDPVTGLAVLRAEVAGLRPARTEAEAEVGDSAVTLAGPAGHTNEPSVTVGVVSALAVQADTDDGAIRELVQLDRPVPTAADGGLVVDADGRMLGVALDLGVDGAPDDGIGHIVPAGTARQVAADLLDHGRVRRAWLGAQGSDLPSDQAADLDLPGGVVVELVQDGSPAADAGIVPGDVIVALDGRSVRSVDELVVAIHHGPIGEPVEVTSVRDGARVTATLTMVRVPDLSSYFRPTVTVTSSLELAPDGSVTVTRKTTVLPVVPPKMPLTRVSASSGSRMTARGPLTCVQV